MNRERLRLWINRLLLGSDVSQTGGAQVRVRTVSLRNRQIGAALLRLALVVGPVVFAAVWLTSWADADETCQSCHLVSGVQTTSHESVPCASCHRPRGAVGTARYSIDYVRMGAVGYALNQEAIAETGWMLDESSCLRCHTTILDNPATEGSAGVFFEHRHFVEQGVRCDRCHAGLGHRVETASARSPMSVCMRCHLERGGEQECGFCHLGRPSDQVSERRIYTGRVIVGDGGCVGCHSVALHAECISCHGGYEMPHPAGWTDGGHWYPGLTDQDDCFECHTPPTGVEPAAHGVPWGDYGGSFCNRCHTYPTPHPPAAQWIRSHGAASRGEYVPHPVCLDCHGLAVAQVRDCITCHSQKACDVCHAERDARRRSR